MTAPFPQTLSDLQTYIGRLVNDTSFGRYTLPMINSQLDIAQTIWNTEAQICRSSVTLTTVANQQTYALSGLTGTIIKPLRVAHKNLPLNRRSKDYFDLFSAVDISTVNGTPKDYFIDINAAIPNVTLYPVPQSNDAGVNLLVEYLLSHQQMINPTDTPFTSPAGTNSLIVPFIFGIGLEAAAALLEPDPTAETVRKASIFRSQANAVRSIVVQRYAELEWDEPLKMQGGRTFGIGRSQVMTS